MWSAGDIILLHINTQMRSLYLQEENALSEGTENEILWYFRFHNSSYFDKNFPTGSQIQIIVCMLASSEHVPLFPTAFVAEPVHDCMHVTNTISPYYIILWVTGKNIPGFFKVSLDIKLWKSKRRERVTEKAPSFSTYPDTSGIKPRKSNGILY